MSTYPTYCDVRLFSVRKSHNTRLRITAGIVLVWALDGAKWLCEPLVTSARNERARKMAA